jgi:hypothetical protein
MNASITVTETAALLARPGALLAVLLTGAANAASVTLYDNATTNSGNVLAVVKAAINTSVSWIPPGGQVCASGIYAVVTGTAPSLTVVYQ